jgi:beta-alanine--pyruvate transaminase
MQPLDAYWMPFTANRQFKNKPRLMAAAKDMHYITHDNRHVLDLTSGLWCVNAGHARPRIIQAIAEQAARLDYSPAFQMGHPQAFELASRLSTLAPQGLTQTFFTNSGSEAVDTALKMAIAYHANRGESQRTRLIGKEKAYHGCGFGGISVGGLPNNRQKFGAMLPGVDHLPSTHFPEQNAFSRGLTSYGTHTAEVLESIIELHGAPTIAALIIEPVQGSAGVLVPPKGYLERLAAICKKHGILLIFDEVITGFGRLGSNFGGNFFNITPDIMTVAKGLTNGAVPMGAVLARHDIYEAFMQGPQNNVEFFHGYTYSGHPLATAAALATLDTYAEEQLFSRAATMSKPFEDAVHSLKTLPNVVDIRNLGLMAAIELAPRDNAKGARGFETYLKCFEEGALVRSTGDIIALSPPFIVEDQHLQQMCEILTNAIQSVE